MVETIATTNRSILYPQSRLAVLYVLVPGYSLTLPVEKSEGTTQLSRPINDHPIKSCYSLHLHIMRSKEHTTNYVKSIIKVTNFLNDASTSDICSRNIFLPFVYETRPSTHDLYRRSSHFSCKQHYLASLFRRGSLLSVIVEGSRAIHCSISFFI